MRYVKINLKLFFSLARIVQSKPYGRSFLFSPCPNTGGNTSDSDSEVVSGCAAPTRAGSACMSVVFVSFMASFRLILVSVFLGHHLCVAFRAQVAAALARNFATALHAPPGFRQFTIIPPYVLSGFSGLLIASCMWALSISWQRLQ